jgi:phosphoribosyl-ATP pyrophosphohydrolase
VREAGELARIEFDGMLAKADSTTVVVDKAPLAEAVQKWGSFQIDMAIEECAEFIVAAEHFKRSRDNNVAEEIADALIMLTQMALMFDTQTVQEIVNKKIDRLKYRLSIGDMEGKQ